MNAAAHYSEAERILFEADSKLEDCVARFGEEDAVAGFNMAIARAQVHATLALAAAAQSAQDDIARCPHGSTGICMACLTPFIDHYGQQLVAGVRR